MCLQICKHSTPFFSHLPNVEFYKFQNVGKTKKKDLLVSHTADVRKGCGSIPDLTSQTTLHVCLQRL